jgi:phosphoribosylaminoimidazole carboxylase (NCAIR synthetase)
MYVHRLCMFTSVQGNLGVRVSVLDPSNPAPAAVAAHQTVGSFANAKAIEEFVSGQSIDVLTVEIEHVDVDAIESAANKYGVQVLPSPATLRIIQDKLLQKQHFQGCNIPVSAFADVPDEVRTSRHAGQLSSGQAQSRSNNSLGVISGKHCTRGHVCGKYIFRTTFQICAGNAWNL